VYDADAGFLRGYEPSYDFTFHGWRNGVMVIRHKDGTLFSALSSIAFDGPRKGEHLAPLPTIQSDWGYWLRAYPKTVAYNMFDKYQPVELPRTRTPQSVATRGPLDPRPPPEAEVVGLRIDGAARAYPLPASGKSSALISDRLSGRDIVLLWHGPTHAGAIYAPEVEGSDRPQRVTLSVDESRPDAPFVDAATGSHWGVEGRAVDGPLKGKTLRWLDSVQCRWFAWAGEYPTTDVYQEKGAAGGAGVQRPVPAAEKPRVCGIIVDPMAVTADQVMRWKASGLNAVAVVLDEHQPAEAYAAAAKAATTGPLDVYYWIEIARNPAMAEAHPRWMASLGVHADWQRRFPAARLPGQGEVAKAFPWVPIRYREAYDAHLDRVRTLLAQRASAPYAGLLLNDLQGGPASCGCGNLQCRWATDYHVPSTATKLEGDDVAARFLADLRKLAPGKSVVPVWTTECEDIDLPPHLAPGGKSTGLSGTVPCASATCPKAFTKQLMATLDAYDGPLGVLALQGELERDAAHGAPGSFAPRAVNYLDTVLTKNAGAAIAHERLWLVIQGRDLSPADATAARQAAAKLGPGGIFQALVPLDQSFEPRVISAN
jgi:hypothetical protein